MTTRYPQDCCKEDDTLQQLLLQLQLPLLHCCLSPQSKHWTLAVGVAARGRRTLATTLPPTLPSTLGELSPPAAKHPCMHWLTLLLSLAAPAP